MLLGFELFISGHQCSTGLGHGGHLWIVPHTGGDGTSGGSADGVRRCSRVRDRQLVRREVVVAEHFGSEDAVRVVDNPTEDRFEGFVGERLVGFVTYRATPGSVALLHAEINPDLRGHGLGSALAHGVLEAARARGVRVTPRCPFIVAYVEDHPEYDDLVG